MSWRNTNGLIRCIFLRLLFHLVAVVGVEERMPLLVGLVCAGVCLCACVCVCVRVCVYLCVYVFAC